ncbi:MAG: TolC family protein [Candidatus Omnitrophota bacterium]
MRFPNGKIFVIASLSLFLGVALVVNAAEPLALSSETALADTFSEYCTSVVEHYPALIRQYATLEQAIASKYRAYAVLFPRVSGTSSVTTTDDPVQVFGSLLRQESFTSANFELPTLNSPRHRTNFHFGIEGEMQLFNAFQTVSAIRRSRHLERSEKLKKEFAVQEARLVAHEAFTRVLLAGEKGRALEEVEKQTREDMKQAEDLKEKGMVLGADFYAAKIIRSQIIESREEAQSELAQAGVLANLLRGEFEPLRRFETRGAMHVPEPGDTALDAWVALARKNRKDLQALQEQIEAAKSDVFREKMSHLPKISGQLAMTEDSHDLSSGGENFMIAAKGTMPLLDPEYLPRIREAKARLKGLEAEKVQLEDEITSAVSREFYNLQALDKNIETVGATLQDAQEAVEQTALLYREGRKSIADLLEIRAAYLATSLRYSGLLAQAMQASARLYFVSGSLEGEYFERVVSGFGA